MEEGQRGRGHDEIKHASFYCTPLHPMHPSIPVRPAKYSFCQSVSFSSGRYSMYHPSHLSTHIPVLIASILMQCRHRAHPLLPAGAQLLREGGGGRRGRQGDEEGRYGIPPLGGANQVRSVPPELSGCLLPALRPGHGRPRKAASQVHTTVRLLHLISRGRSRTVLSSVLPFILFFC